MIHRTSVEEVGSDEEHERAASAMAECDEAMLGIYATRSGLAESVVAELMQTETWMCAADSIAWGFADALA